MTIQVNASVTFEAADREEANAAIQSMNPPEGARVHVSSTEVLATGTYQEGQIMKDEIPEMPAPGELVEGADDVGNGSPE